MRAFANGPRRGGAAIAAGLLMLAIAAGGCSTNSASDAPASSGASSPSVADRMGSLFSSKSSAGGGSASASAGIPNPITEIECPNVDIRTGAATLMIGSKPTEGPPDPLDLRYQGTIVRAARECAVNAGMVTMKVGVEGRLIKGPAGGPGQIEVPLRVAVVEEGPSPKTVLSKFYRVPVTVGDDAHTGFTKVDSEIAFPMPDPPALIDRYIVYIGFDPAGAQSEKRPAVKRRKR